MNKLEKKLFSFAFFRRYKKERIRILKAKIELQKDFLSEYEKHFQAASKKKIAEFADRLEDHAAASALFVDFSDFKQQKLAEFDAKQEKKNNLKWRAFRETQKRKGTFSEESLEALKAELQAKKAAATEEFSKALDAEYASFKQKNANAKPIGEVREQNAEKVKEFEVELLQKTESKFEKTKGKVAQRISDYEAEIKQLTEKLALTDQEEKFCLSEETLLKVENLCMYFGGVKAVDGVDFEVKKGEIFGLIGPNGAGKTTVFNCITQFYKPVKGEIFFAADSETVRLNHFKVHDVSSLGIFRTFQNLEVIREISVLDNLLVAAHRTYTTGIFSHVFHTPLFKQEETAMRARAQKVLEFLGIGQYAFFPAFGLPYGILKKIEVARTLMSNPKLIILDEPAAGLNDTETAELGNLIKKIAKEYNCTVLLVEHDMGLVMDICDRILAISFGKPLAIGTPSQIQKSKEVQAAYLGTEQTEEVNQ